ncbi:hypothetical protein GF343_05360 [Candidatus Woesearchaeota archaeon]|nr:hypothetical protein [Candidatus Woesearchaeota archaeon]
MENKTQIGAAPDRASVARIEGALYRGAEQYFKKEGFVHVASVPHMVDITGACENVDTLYEIDYHGKTAFLTQTGQTGLEILLADGLEKVCCMIHSFRKEEQADNRHLTEFPLVELEFAYNPSTEDGFEQLLGHIEKTIKSMIRNAVETEGKTLEMLGTDVLTLENVLKHPFYRISYDDAVKMLPVEWGRDLEQRDERLLVTSHGRRPLFVTRYPEEIKFFNMQRNKENPLVVNSTDLLLPYSGEAVGAAVRESNYDLLVEKLKKSDMFRILSGKGKTLEDFRTYLDAVKANPVPHAGCGIGLPRVTQFVLGTKDIKKATAYPMNKHSL